MDNRLFSLEGKTALVIGYAGNLGPIWIEALNNAGARTYGLGMPPVKEKAGGAPHNILDVTRPADFYKFDYIKPDILVYNAAIDNPPDAGESGGWDMFRNYEKITQVNQFGAVNTMRFFIPEMIKNGGGSIHLIGSIMGYGPPDNSNYPSSAENGEVWEKPLAYGTSKRSYLNMAQWVTKKYGEYGIRCTVPAFGPIDMGQLSPEFMEKIADKIPMRKFTSIKDLQRTLLFHTCCENFAGQDTLVDGGYREL